MAKQSLTLRAEEMKARACFFEEVEYLMAVNRWSRLELLVTLTKLGETSLDENLKLYMSGVVPFY